MKFTNDLEAALQLYATRRGCELESTTSIKATLVEENGKFGAVYAHFPSEEELRSFTVMSVFEVIADSSALAKAALEQFVSSRHLSDLYVPSELAHTVPAGFNEVKNGWLWVNTNLSFYVYRIWATESPKYYIGVRQLRIAGATVEDCLSDDYMGSGSVKFKNWLRIHPHAQKEIVAICSSKAEAYALEAELVGELWRTDNNCLNSASGGRTPGYRKPPTLSHSILTCATHGRTTHTSKGLCVRCRANRTFSDGTCSIHGEVIFRSGRCARCLFSSRVNEAECRVHGMSKHVDGYCMTCQADSVNRIGLCAIHGESSFFGNSCRRCSASLRWKTSICQIHGEGTFDGDNCAKCIASTSGKWSKIECRIHGVTFHQGATCCRCAAVDAVHEGVCEKHGSSSFTGDVCNRCRAEASVSVRNCKIHGEVKFVGDQCRHCVNSRASNMRECVHHGLTVHQGAFCAKCNSQRTAHRRFHEAKPNGSCFLCETADQVSVE